VNGPELFDAQAPFADAATDAQQDAARSPNDGALSPDANATPDASGNPTDSARGPDGAALDAGTDAAHRDSGTPPIPIDASTSFKPSPVPLADLVGTGSESRAELVSRLRDHVLSTPELFRPYSYAGTNWAQAADDLVANGWQANQAPPVAMVPPIDWSEGRGDANWHYQLNSLRPSIPFAYAAWRTDDVESLRRMLAVVDDWIDFNLIENRANGKKWYDMGAGLRAHYVGVTLTELLRR
jgi:hypothetical protein